MENENKILELQNEIKLCDDELKSIDEETRERFGVGSSCNNFSLPPSYFDNKKERVEEIKRDLRVQLSNLLMMRVQEKEEEKEGKNNSDLETRVSLLEKKLESFFIPNQKYYVIHFRWINVTEDDRARIDYIKDFESFDSAKKYMETLDREVCSDIVGPLMKINS